MILLFTLNTISTFIRAVNSVSRDRAILMGEIVDWVSLGVLLVGLALTGLATV